MLLLIIDFAAKMVGAFALFSVLVAGEEVPRVPQFSDVGPSANIQLFGGAFRAQTTSQNQ